MKRLFFSCLISLTVFSVKAQDAVDLRLNLEKNRIYRFSSSSDQHITQTVNGVQQTSAVNSASVTSFKVMDLQPSFFVAEIRFDTLLTTTNSMGKPVIMNSANPGNMASGDMSDVMSCIMNRLSKNPLFAKISYSGKVMEIVNAKMLSDIILKDTALITGPTAGVLKTQAAGNADSKTLTSMIESITGQLPGKEIQKGETWTSSNSVNSGGMALDIVNTYKLEQADGNVIAVSALSDLHPSANAKPMDYGTATVDYQNLRGSGKSVIELDAKTGLTRKSTSKTHMAGNLQVSGQGFNITMPMEMDGESVIVAIP